jgi:CheY-like chemotaxis protein
MTPRLVVIVGPTAAGKTSLACELAPRLSAEIVSADSQQCYRGLDAGTAKPSAAERAIAPHHLIDVRDPEEQLDAAQFVQLADAAIADIPVVVLSADANPARLEQLGAAGAAGYVSKPIDAASLLEVVWRHARKAPSSEVAANGP